jgi:hypothetical protein
MSLLPPAQRKGEEMVDLARHVAARIDPVLGVDALLDRGLDGLMSLRIAATQLLNVPGARPQAAQL